MSILRELFVKLGLDVDQQAFAKGVIAANGLTAALEVAVQAAVELSEAFIENVQQVSEFGERTLILAQETGLSTAATQQLGRAAAVEGQSVEEFSLSMVRLSRAMYQAKRGSEEEREAFRKLGVSVTDGTGQLRPAQDVLLGIANRFSTMDGAEKTALAMQLFGRSGYGMIELLNHGKELGDYLTDQSFVLSKEQLEAGKEVVQTQRALTFQTQDLWRSAVGPLLPAIRDLLKQFLAWKKENADLIRQNLTRFLYLGLAAVKDLGIGFRGFVRILKFFGDNWKAVVAVVVASIAEWTLANVGLIASMEALQWSAIGAAIKSAAAWAIAAAPFVIIGGVIAGLLLLFDDLRVYAAGGDSLFGDFVKNMDIWQNRITKGGVEEPGWFSWLRKARIELAGILQTMQALGWIDENKNFYAPSTRADIGTRQTQRRNAAAGVSYYRTGSEEEKSGIGSYLLHLGGLPDDDPYFAGQPSARPSLAPVARGPFGSGLTVQLSQQVYALPGMDEQRVADIAAQQAGKAIADHVGDLQANSGYNEPQ